MIYMCDFAPALALALALQLRGSSPLDSTLLYVSLCLLCILWRATHKSRNLNRCLSLPLPLLYLYALNERHWLHHMLNEH